LLTGALAIRAQTATTQPANTVSEADRLHGEYLRHAAIPTLELKFDPQAHTVAYRWQADEPAFAMPIKVGDKDHWQIIAPVTTRWQTLKTPLDSNHFDVATDLYYVNVRES
jgi:hypothetical protein